MTFVIAGAVVADHPVPVITGFHKLKVPSNPEAEYHLVALQHGLPGRLIATTHRNGPSGKSYSVREIECDSATFRYLAEADGDIASLMRKTHENAMGRLTGGSISTEVSQQVCAMAGLYMATPL